MFRAVIPMAMGLVLGLPASSFAQASPAEPASPTEQLSTAQEIVFRGDRLSSRIATMITQSQRERDIIRVNCLDDKLAQVNANLRTARARLDVLHSQNDPQMRNQAVTVMLVLGQKFQVLDQEASQCIGQNVFETGSTRLETQVDTALVPTLEESDPTLVPDLVPPPDLGGTETQTPPPPEEVSGNS